MQIVQTLVIMKVRFISYSLSTVNLEMYIFDNALTRPCLMYGRKMIASCTMNALLEGNTA